MAELDTISIKVEATGADTAAKSIDTLVSSLSRLNSATTNVAKVNSLLISLKNLGSTSASMTGVVSSLDSLKTAMQGFSGASAKNVTALTDALRPLIVTMKELDSTSTNGVSLLVNSLGYLKGASATNISKISHALPNLAAAMMNFNDPSIESASQVLSRTAIAMNTLSHSVSGLNGNLAGVAARMGDVARRSDDVTKAVEGSGKKVKSLGGDFGGLKGVLDGVKSWFLKATEPVRNFLSSLSRIAGYRTIRAILKAITDAIKTGVTDIYEYSKAVGTTLAPAMDSAASAMLTFKNSIGAALAPAIESLIPVLEQVCGWLTTFNNKLAEVFAALSGKTTFTAAIATTTKWGDETKKTTGAVKELKNQLMGFDELNVLNAPSSGGSGGGAASLDYSSMFEERDVSAQLQEFNIRMKDILFNWDNLNAENVLQKLLTAFNGVIGGVIGFTLAGPIGAVVGTLGGVAVGIGISKMLFDGDGKLSAIEIMDSIAYALGAALSLGVGYVVGGSRGAMLTFSLYSALTLKFGIKVSTDDLAEDTDLNERIRAYKLRKESDLGKELRDSYLDVGEYCTDGFKEGLESKMSSHRIGVIDTFKQVINWICGKEVFDIGSPSKTFHGIGEFVIQGFFNGISDEIKRINPLQPIKDWYNNSVVPWVTGRYDSFKSAGGTWMTRFKTGISNKVGSVIQPLKDAYNNSIVPWVTGRYESFKSAGGTWMEKFRQGLNAGKSAIVGVFDSLGINIKTPINTIISVVESMANKVVSGINTFIRALNRISFTIPAWVAAITGIGGGARTFSLNISEVSTVSIPRLASGGMLDNDGQLFVAREAGPELVGSYGGKSAVMNNDQIVESVSRGVYQAVRDAMSEQNGKSTTINVDGRRLFEVMVDRNNSTVRRTGKSPLLV